MSVSSLWGLLTKDRIFCSYFENQSPVWLTFLTDCALLAQKCCSVNMERWQPIYWCHLECAEVYKSLLISGHLTGTGWNVLAATQAVSQGVDSPEVCPSCKIYLWLFGSWL